jgi:hypothetical protein
MSPAFALAFFLTLPAQNPYAIVQRSVANTNHDWAVAPQFAFTERDMITKSGETTVKSYQVMMIDGSPYDKLISENGRLLSAAEAAEQDRELREEIARRQHESTAERNKRITEYMRGRRQDHELMSQMAKAFNYILEGEETINGRRCFVLVATPKPSYVPINRDTKVLKGMRGKLWIDEKDYQWVKVHAEVFRPVAFGLFIAHVQPGTEFTLEERPVEGNIWEPVHFEVKVKASILWWQRNSVDNETYSNYHRAGQQSMARTASPPVTGR